jgi:hypothetical protein
LQGGFVVSQSDCGISLTPEQENEAARMEERVLAAMAGEVRRMCRLLASKKNPELFGQTEFDLRDMVHRAGAKALEVAAQERQKKGRIRGC